MSGEALGPQLLGLLARALGGRRAMVVGPSAGNDASDADTREDRSTIGTGQDPHVAALRAAGYAVSLRAAHDAHETDAAEGEDLDPGKGVDPAAGDDATPPFPDDLDLLYLAPGARLARPPGRAVVLAADPAGLPAAGYAGVEADAPGWTAIRVALGPAADAPRFAMAMAGRLPAKARAELTAIAQASRRERPTQPLPEDAGAFLWFLQRARRTRRAWELGGGVGASTIWLAAGLRQPGGRLTVLERDAARHKRARGHVARAGLADRVDLQLGESARRLRHLSDHPSLVLLDHDLFDRAEDLLAIVPRCNDGALVIAHGMHEEIAAHARYRALLATQPEIAAETTLAVGRGLSLSLLEG